MQIETRFRSIENIILKNQSGIDTQENKEVDIK